MERKPACLCWTPLGVLKALYTDLNSRVTLIISRRAYRTMTINSLHMMMSTEDKIKDFSDGLEIKNPLSNAGDMGSIPGPGRSQVPPGQRTPCATTTESTSSGACTLHLERSSTTTKIPRATVRTQCSQINNFFCKKKMKANREKNKRCWLWATWGVKRQNRNNRGTVSLIHYLVSFFCFPTGPNQFYIAHIAQILGKIWRHNLTYNISNTLTWLKETATGCFSGKPVSSTSWTSQPICRAHMMEHGILSSCEVYKETLH